MPRKLNRTLLDKVGAIYNILQSESARNIIDLLLERDGQVTNNKHVYMALGLSQSYTSIQIGKLLEVGIIESQRISRKSYYTLNKEALPSGLMTEN